MIQVQVTGYRRKKQVINVCDTEEQMKRITVLQLKEKIIETLSISSDMCLVFINEPMEESNTLSSYGIKHLSTILILLKLAGGGRLGADEQ